MKRQLLIVPIVLGSLLLACGDRKEPAQSQPRDTIIPLEDLAPGGAGYDPANEEAFEDLVYKEYAILATRIPKKQADSLLKATIARTKDPKNMSEELQKAMAPLRERYNAIARQQLAEKYGISLDSVEAIIAEVKERNKSGREDR